MNDAYQQMSLLYELSLSITKSDDPATTAGNFIRKLLSRKNLNYGAIWLLENQEEKYLTFRQLYSMPHFDHESRIRAGVYKEYFGHNRYGTGTYSLFESNERRGYYAYIKLGELGLIELYSRSHPDKLKPEVVYPMADVADQLALSIKSSLRYRRLQEEIAEREKAEQLLKAQEEKYHRIIENIRLGLIEVDNDNIILHANQSFLDLLGWSLPEILGKNAKELFLDDKAQKKMERQTQRRLEGKSGSYEIALTDKNGNEKWVVISGAPNYNKEGQRIGSIGIHLDISHQKRLAEEFAFKEAQLENFFGESLDALITIDKHGNILQWNPQAEKTFGFDREEVIGKALHETIIPHNYRSAHQKGMKNFFDTGEGPVLNNRIEITALDKSGREFPIELTVFHIKHAEEHFFTAFLRDISELKESRENMVKALEKQKELNTLKSQFISMTSHELRTPLTTIRTDVELVNYQLENMPELDRKRLRNNLSRIDTSADRLHQLINNILLIGQMDTHKVPFAPVDTDIEELLKKKILTQHPTIKYQVEGDPYRLDIDHKLFTHIMENLVQNAYKYSADRQEPELTLQFGEAGVKLMVKDHGIGIPERDQKRLFETFYRASNVGNVQGSGLGLAIVKEFVKLHGGFITFSSKESIGTIFTVHFPIKPVK
ncbi:PAS domain S-box protein [Roseivirga sp. BDSF3-8]|uniref:sensor histidine kinase n=1 Tax=Roseivirga sp. BDSF3-8 TaxID=3241598 RepID=UPI003531B6FB